MLFAERRDRTSPMEREMGVGEGVKQAEHTSPRRLQDTSGAPANTAPGSETPAQRRHAGEGGEDGGGGGGGGGGGDRKPFRPSGWPGVDADLLDAPPRPDLDLSEQRIILNVGGVRHETRLSTLTAIPNTRLSRLAQTHSEIIMAATPSPAVTSPSLSPISPPGTLIPPTEYFFDRHPAVFNAVIDFYRTGELHVPLEVCGAVVKRELDFWQIDELEIKACCWRHYRSYIENQKILDSFNQSLIRESYQVDLEKLRGWRKFQMRVWLILDHPRTSKYAMAYGIVSFLFVMTSIAGFCLETLPGLRPETQYNVSITCGDEIVMGNIVDSNVALFVLDIICTIFFSLELILRFIFAPNKLKFVISPMNIIDLLALVPLYVTVITQASDQQACYMNERFVIEIMFILRIFRMFRIFHLVKHYQALKVLVYAMRASLQELLMLFIFLLIAMLVFATMIYYAERQDAVRPSEQFNTIPVGFWWAIITMTTVGYGDVSPVTPVGYVVGTACCVVGVLLVALTFPVISNNFTLFYQHVRSRPVKQVLARAASGTMAGLGGICAETDEEKGGGGGAKGSTSAHRLIEEEELLLYSPVSSPSHSGLRKMSTGSNGTEPFPYMNGGALNRAPSRGSSTGRAMGNSYLNAPPTLAKFSDSNSMTDIILSKGSRLDGEPPRQSTHKPKRGGSVSSRQTQSDDGMRYHGETRL